MTTLATFATCIMMAIMFLSQLESIVANYKSALANASALVSGLVAKVKGLFTKSA